MLWLSLSAPLRKLRLFRWLCIWVLAFLWIFCSLLLKLSSTHATQTPTCAPALPSAVVGTLTPVAPKPGLILINEILSNPASTWNCSEPAGSLEKTKDSWFELYNPQSSGLDLAASRARISLDGKANWAFLPPGSTIASHGYLVLFPLQWLLVKPPEAWNIVLDIGGVVIDQAIAPSLQADQSYARLPDGSNDWQITGHPTINASNNSAIPQTATHTSTTTKTPATGDRSHTTPTPVNSGTQPVWQQIQLPSNSTITPDPSSLSPTSATLQHPPAADAHGNNQGPGTGILIVALLALLAGISFAGWRFFRAT